MLDLPLISASWIFKDHNIQCLHPFLSKDMWEEDSIKPPALCEYNYREVFFQIDQVESPNVSLRDAFRRH